MSSSEDNSILLIDNSKNDTEFIERELRAVGYKVYISFNGICGLKSYRELNPDLIILDRMLPQMDGIEICKKIRQLSDIPIVILTSKNDILDKVNGLDSGANDYMLKPFNIEELLARLRAHLRIRKPFEKSTLEFLDLTIDLKTREVERDGKKIVLSPKEYELLILFMKRPRYVLSKEKIFESLWGLDFKGMDAILEVYIHSLRKKIEINNMPRIIHTVRSVGYILNE